MQPLSVYHHPPDPSWPEQAAASGRLPPGWDPRRRRPGLDPPQSHGLLCVLLLWAPVLLRAVTPARDGDSDPKRGLGSNVSWLSFVGARRASFYHLLMLLRAAPRTSGSWRLTQELWDRSAPKEDAGGHESKPYSLWLQSLTKFYLTCLFFFFFFQL